MIAPRGRGRRLALVSTMLVAWASTGSLAAARPHWAEGSVIQVWIDPSNAPAGGDALVERAMATWTEAGAGHFTMRRTGAKDAAAVRVHFFTPDYRYGMTSPRVDPHTGLIVRAEVIVAGQVEGDALARSIVTYLTALHELGHALGLSHTDDSNTIMFLFRRPGDGDRFFGAYRAKVGSVADIGSRDAPGLSAADIGALRRLYIRQ